MGKIDKYKPFTSAASAATSVLENIEQRNQVRDSELSDADKAQAIAAHDKIIKQSTKLTLITMGVMLVVDVIGLCWFFFAPSSMKLFGMVIVLVSLVAAIIVMAVGLAKLYKTPEAKQWRIYHEATTLGVSHLPMSELRQRQPNAAEQREIKCLRVISAAVIVAVIAIIAVVASFMYKTSEGWFIFWTVVLVVLMFIIVGFLDKKIANIKRAAYQRSSEEQPQK